MFAATSFHWIDAAVRVTKSADALRAGGALAVVATHNVAGGDELFFADAQRCYERWDPETPGGIRLPATADIPSDREELDASGRFGQLGRIIKRYMNELAVARKA